MAVADVRFAQTAGKGTRRLGVFVLEVPSGRFNYGMGRIGCEMDGDAARAKRYRERADALRKIADGFPANNQQRILIGLALEYERLAKLLEPGDVSFDRLSAVIALKQPDNSN